MVLFLSFLYFFIPIVTSLDRFTITSYLDDSNNLIGLLVPKCPPQLFSIIWPDQSFQITNVESLSRFKNLLWFSHLLMFKVTILSYKVLPKFGISPC